MGDKFSWRIGGTADSLVLETSAARRIGSNPISATKIMKDEDVDEVLLDYGFYCRKGHAECFCKVGWPRERMCPDCGPGRDDLDMQSFCVCPPKV